VFPSSNPKNRNLYAQTNNPTTTPSSNFFVILSGKFECAGMAIRSYGRIAFFVCNVDQ
jgi:hypothetical protein